MILEYHKKNKKGEPEILYTHSSFIDLDKIVKAVEKSKKREGFFQNCIVATTIASAWVSTLLFRS